MPLAAQTYSAEQIDRLMASAKRSGITPANCPHCEYDRRFPETASGGWMYLGNGSPVVSCPVCNADESRPRD